MKKVLIICAALLMLVLSASCQKITECECLIQTNELKETKIMETSGTCSEINRTSISGGINQRITCKEKID